MPRKKAQVVPRDDIPHPEPVMEVVDLSHFQPAKVNPNKGNIHGVPSIEKSIKKNGAGRPMFADKNGEMVGGSHTIQAFENLEYNKAIVVKHDGSLPIIFQRTNVDIDSPQGRSLQIGDNVIGSRSFVQDDELTAMIVNQIGKQDAGFVEAAGFYDSDVRHLSAIVEATIRGISADSTHNNINSNLRVLARDGGTHSVLNWRDIMVILPRDLYDRCEAFIEQPDFESRAAGVIALLERGLSCSG